MGNFNQYEFNGVYGMVIDAAGAVVQAEQLITDAHQLHRGDDAVALQGGAAWITGDANQRQLVIHFVDDVLNYSEIIVE